MKERKARLKEEARQEKELARELARELAVVASPEFNHTALVAAIRLGGDLDGKLLRMDQLSETLCDSTGLLARRHFSANPTFYV